MRAVTMWIPVLALVLFAHGCEKRSWDDKKADPAVVELDVANHTLRTDALGSARAKQHGTFVLVKARNTSSGDLTVDVGGDLLDASGQVVAPLRADSLRLPAGGERVFALVDKDNKPRPTATSAALRVVSARKLSHKAEVVITDGNVYLDNNRVVAAGYVENTVPDRAARILVVAAFFDAAGKPMTRPYTLIKLLGGQKRATRFVGPNGSAQGMLFVGQVEYD